MVKDKHFSPKKYGKKHIEDIHKANNILSPGKLSIYTSTIYVFEGIPNYVVKRRKRGNKTTNA